MIASIGWFNPSVTRILAELRDKLEPFYNELGRSQARPPDWKKMLTSSNKLSWSAIQRLILDRG